MAVAITVVARTTAAVARTTAMARTTPVLGGIMDGRIPAAARTDPVTVQGMPLIQAPSQSRLAIGRTILAALAIMWAARITSGGRDIGQPATVKESGSAATTLCGDSLDTVWSVADKTASVPSAGHQAISRTRREWTRL